MRILRKFAAALTAIIAIGSAAHAQVFVIRNAQVHTMAGAGMIENGDVVIRNGEIAAVGQDLDAPEGATVIDASGRVVTPGVIAPYSNIGLTEIGLDRESNDAGPRSGEGFELSAALDAVDAYNPSSTLLAVNRAGGVTRALAAPQAGDKMFGGQAAVIDLSGRPQSITKPRAAQVAILGYGGARRNGDTRMGAWATMRDTLDEARTYAANPRDYYRRTRDDRFAFSDLEALAAVLNGEQKLFVEIDGAADLRRLIRLKSDYGLDVVIVGGAEAWRVARELAATSIPVILDPLYNLPGQFEEMGATLENAARLNAAGVKIAFYIPPGFGGHNLRALPQLAGNAAANGLPKDAALAALTIYPAQMLGVDARYGALEVGKAADVVIWDGDPLEVTTRPVTVIIDGRITSLENRQTMLRDRYKDLTRGALPHAYRGDE
ncbi:MAG: amidohydrolase family protein [Pseudomonadota bacterium]